MIEPPPESLKRRSRAALWIALLAFVIGTAVTLLFVKYYARLLPSAMRPETVTAAPASSGFVPPPERGLTPPSVDAEALAARQANLAADLATLEARAGAVDRDARAAAANAGRAEGLLVAFAARRAIDRGVGLGLLESALRERFAATQPRAVALVLDVARTPVTIEDLRLGLETLAPQLTNGLRDAGLAATLQREIAGLVVIRRAGSPSPRPVDRLARARRALDSGQVEVALAEVRRLPGAARAASWTAAAERYVSVHQALDQLELAALSTPVMPVMLPAPPAPAAPGATSKPTAAPTEQAPTR
ncbi:MAG: hypothetical protein K2X76_13335 [Sphingomonas sp.]|nr:hypothetical protein [Sphingomonas sp.]